MKNNRHIEDEELNKCMKLILERLDRIEEKIDKFNKVKNVLEDDELLDNQDLCLLLNISKRTLQRYRQKKLIKYYMINEGKAYYKKSELPEFLLKKIK